MVKQKSWLIPVIIIGAIILVLVLGYVSIYNSLIKQNEAVNGQWAQVETQYQRRVDLIPNLVSTVQGYANFEKSTLSEITALRSQWQNAETINEKVTTANQIESTLSKLLIISENYPDLKANQNFIALQDELANTENKIAVERGRYNNVVQIFNAKIKLFPNNMVAGSLGYSDREYFKSNPDANTAPDVDFTQ